MLEEPKMLMTSSVAAPSIHGEPASRGDQWNFLTLNGYLINLAPPNPTYYYAMYALFPANSLADESKLKWRQHSFVDCGDTNGRDEFHSN
jgi:hypothetical protein